MQVTGTASGTPMEPETPIYPALISPKAKPGPMYRVRQRYIAFSYLGIECAEQLHLVCCPTCGSHARLRARIHPLI